MSNEMMEASSDWIRRRLGKLRLAALRLLWYVATGTALASLLSLCYPLIRSAGKDLIDAYLDLPTPPHAIWRVLAMLGSLLLIALLARLPSRIWRSLRLGLISLDWIWMPAVALSWLAYEKHYAQLAWGSLAVAALVTFAAILASLNSENTVDPSGSRFIEPDLPVPEGGEDLLGRRELIESVVSTILLEPPTIIAVTGKYGDGKTSFLNLAIGELNKSEELEVPIIVRFSPWLAGNSNALVLSLLNSIVAGINSKLLVPGLSADAARYARTLLSVVPWTERLKDLVGEPSQEQRIDALVNRVARVRRRVLVVLDDLDRMGARELETVLKILRGSEKLSNVTFLCAFDKVEVGKILRTGRRHQNTAIFIEKFFPLEFRLPEIDSAQLRSFFSQGIVRVLECNALPHTDLLKSLEEIWEGGAELHFRNLRRIKLVLNKINRSFGPIADEVNIEDFVRLEMIRDISPSLYDQIYLRREWFWNREFAFEASFKGPNPLDKEKAKQERGMVYKEVEASVPKEKQYALQLLENMFPHFAVYRQKSPAGVVDPVDAEKNRRIFHPRCFRQYFLSKIPSELFPQKEFGKFFSSVRQAHEDAAAEAFTKTFQSIVNEDFKRWHFMHLIENRFEEFELQAARGLCRGMARKSALWPTDAFELMIAIRSTRDTLGKIEDSAERQEFLREIGRESTSDLYTLMLVRQLEGSLEVDRSVLAEGEPFKAVGFSSPESDTNAKLMCDLQEIKGYIKDLLREHYLKLDAPSVFDQFGSFDSHSIGVNRIEPNLFLFNWQLLGADAQADEREYLRNLFARRPQDVDAFLKLMFRVDFIDDYTTLKPLIDYKELSELVTQNESIIDRDKVEQFRARYNTELGRADDEKEHGLTR
jgi:hypothetical protein